MQEELNIIGDVAGQYKTLMALLEKMPKNAKPLLVGDLIDRGPKSHKVVAWARENAWVLKGNHEHMMCDFVFGRHQYAEKETWFLNGGGTTVHSYAQSHDSLKRLREVKFDQLRELLRSDAEWMDKLPLYHEQPGLFVSHAPVPVSQRDSYWQAEEFGFVWNRYQPDKPWEGKFTVHGHNSRFKVYAENDEPWGYCIDNSYNDELMGMHWPSKEIFREPYRK